jgi:phospholipid/cholesterol/gamma-HCH transport system substrate-binding protein
VSLRLPGARRKRRSASGKSSGRRGGMPALLIAAIMIAIPVFVTYYAFHKALPFTSSYTDYVVVPNSVNLRSGAPVRISGIDVGQVTGVSSHGDATKIAFTLDPEGRPIHTDATVTVRDRLFLEGAYYLDLFPGSPSAPVAGEGFTIPERNAQTPVQFFQLLSTFDSAARGNLKQLLNTANQAFSAGPGRPLSQSGAAGFKQAASQLTPLLRDVAIDSRALTGTQPGDLEKLLAGFAGVAGTLQRNQGHLVSLIDGLDQVSGSLAASDGALAQSIAGLDQTLQAAPGALAAVDRALPPLGRLAAALTPSLRISPPLIRQVTAAVNGVIEATGPSVRGRLISSLRTTLASFPVMLTQIGHLFAISRPVTDCLMTHVLPILQAQVPDGALSTHEPVWKDFVHFLPSLASASAQFDALGPYVRTVVGAGNNGISTGTLGSVPLLGQLIGSSPGGSPIQGVAPKWVGTLTAKAFRPDVECSSDPVPNLSASRTAAADFKPDRAAAVFDPTVAELRRALSLATGKPMRSLP